ncbi:MAG: SCO family protein [Anaeromyxobacter sp.]|nr:SCO family protein [Anaeromyxobacter sp.]MBL0277854.1 SCO family protein [Anaeromyxobacter sp.]
MHAAARRLLFGAPLAMALLSAPALAGEPASEAAAPPADDKPCCHKKPADEAALPAGMNDPDQAAPASGPAAGAGALPPPVSVTLVDAPLLDQDGREVRFARDVVGDRIVVVDFVFTTCTTICPILSAKLAGLQGRLGDRLGKGVGLVSVSIDPARDTPERLKAHAAKFKARPGWTWLTGEPETVNKVLKGLGAYTPNFNEHTPIMLVGDGRTGRWARFNGFPDPARLEAAIDALEAARPAVTASRP